MAGKSAIEFNRHPGVEPSLFVCAAPFDLNGAGLCRVSQHESVIKQRSKSLVQIHQPASGPNNVSYLKKSPSKSHPQITNFLRTSLATHCPIASSPPGPPRPPGPGGSPRAPAGSSVHCLAHHRVSPIKIWGLPRRIFPAPPQVPNGDQPQKAGHGLVDDVWETQKRDIYLIA